MVDTLYNLQMALLVLQVYAMMNEEGSWSFNDSIGVLDGDFYYDTVFDALTSCFAYTHMSGDEDESYFYFSDPCFTNYFRLCREHSRRRRLKLKKNPFVIRAKQFVDSQLSGPYTCSHKLRIKKGKWGSGLYFYYSCDFTEEFELLERLLVIKRFFLSEITELKAELAKPTALAVITPFSGKAAA